MGIDVVRLKNFTVFDDFELKLANGVNVFIGENGTGKTHLLKAIYAVCEAIRNPEVDGKFLSQCFNENDAECQLLRNTGTVTLTVSVVPEGTEGTHIVGAMTIPMDIDERREYNPNAKEILPKNYFLEFPRGIKYLATYVPSKDMLTHSNGFLAMASKYQRFPFDKTLTDILRRTSEWTLKEPPALARNVLPVLESMLKGRITFDGNDFCVEKHDGRKISFKTEAEGLKKIGLLWQLLMTENIIPNGILIWDEPEANLNPKFLPNLAECLLELSRGGVQIVLSTHNYIFAKYFDVLKSDADSVKYHSLYFGDDNGSIQCETSDWFEALKRTCIASCLSTYKRKINFQSI